MKNLALSSLFKYAAALAVVAAVFPSCTRRLLTDSFDEAAAYVASQLDSALMEDRKATVAAVGFKDANDTPLFRSREEIDERINHHLSQQSRLVWVDYGPESREMLVEVLYLVENGLYDEEKIPEIGHFKPPEYLATGFVQRHGGEAEIQARLVRVETSEVVKSAKAVFPLGQSLLGKTAWTVGLILALSVLILVLLAARPRKVPEEDRSLGKFEPTNCGWCGAKIDNQYKVGGNCMGHDCPKIICRDCWNGERVTRCSDCAGVR